MIDLDRLKSLLRLSTSRLKILKERLQTQSLQIRSQLYKIRNNQEKYPESMLRVEQLIRDDYLQEAYGIMEMHCQTLLNNLGQLIDVGDKSNGLLMKSVSTIIYSSNKLIKVPELAEITKILKLSIKQQIVYSNAVDEQFVKKVSIIQPNEELCKKYLETIYESYNSKIKEIERDDGELESLEARFLSLRKL